MNSKKVNVRLAPAVVCLVLALGWVGIPLAGMLAAGPEADCPNGPLAATLTGDAVSGVTPAGTARYREKGSNALLVNVRSVNLAANTSVDVYIGETKVGSFAIGRGRNGQLRLETTMATIEEGTTITVRNGSTVVLTGTFACVAGGPNTSPTASPTTSPTGSPTTMPTVSPTVSPTASPTASPTVSPTVLPSVSPTVSPTASPTMHPW